MLGHGRQPLLAVLSDGNHLDVRFQIEKTRKRTTNHGLVFGEDDTDHKALPPNGMSIRNSVPPAAPGPNARVPPAAMTRSRIP